MPEMWESIQSCLKAHEAVAPGTHLSFFKRVGGDFSKAGKIIWEILEKDHPDPLFVVKAPRTGIGKQALRAEYECLQALHSKLPSQLTKGIPKPIYYEEMEQGTFSVETYLPGEKMVCLLRVKTWEIWRKWGPIALSWLGQYSESMPPNSYRLNQVTWETRFLEPFLDHDPFLSSLSPRWKAICDSLVKYQLPTQELVCNTVPSHGDFSPTNILCRGDQIGVIDWAASPETPLPLVDNFHFMGSSALYLAQGLERKLTMQDLAQLPLLAKDFLQPISPLLAANRRLLRIPPQWTQTLAVAAGVTRLFRYLQKSDPYLESIYGWLAVLELWLHAEEVSFRWE
jgi:hypothetical protein